MKRDDDLRARLAAIDPARAGSDADARSDQPWSEAQDRVLLTLEQSRAGDTVTPTRRHHGRPLAVAASLVLVAGAAVGILIATNNRPGHTPDAVSPTTLSLKVAPSGAMTSCIRFDAKYLRDMPVAFAGTVSDVTDEAITLEVDRWYAGGTAGHVTVSVPDNNTSIALDGVKFIEGKRYLVAATNGTVNGCGFSGLATTQLTSAYAQAFGG